MIKWGILGCGGIAAKFVKSMEVVNSGEIIAGASRTGRADLFCKTRGITKAYNDYESLLANKDIDAVYIANTHNFHFETGLAALAAGKNILMEKPFTVNAREAEILLQKAAENNLFLMEAMWARFLPAARKVQEIITSGEIGRVRALRADFCISPPYDPQSRLFNPALAGGALLDVGVYPVSYASMVFGTQPKIIKSSYIPVETGVDGLSSYLFNYDNAQAVLRAGLTVHAQNSAEISGEQGRIFFPDNFYRPRMIELVRYAKNLQGKNSNNQNKNNRETINFADVSETGFSYQIEEVHSCLRAGRKESTIMPLTETLAVMRTLDAVRAGWNFKYAADKKPPQ